MTPASIASVLLVVTGVSHLSQPLVYGLSRLVALGALFGLVYLVLGLLALRHSTREIFWLAVIMCLIGLTLGISRMLISELTGYGIFHQLLHLIIIPASLMAALSRRS